MSKFILYDSYFTPLGVLQNEISVIWFEKYLEPGEVKVTARATEINKSLLVEGNYIFNFDCDTLAYICHIETTEVGQETLIEMRALLTAKMLDDRVVMSTVSVRNVEQSMYMLYSQNRRNLPFEVGTAQGYSEILQTEITWNSVLDALKNLTLSSGLSFKVIFDPNSQTQTFVVYKGIDRTDQENINYVGHLSADVGNIYNVQTVYGTSNYKNVAIIAGAGEGNSRVVRTVTLPNTSNELQRELYVDARDLQMEYQESINTGQKDDNGNLIYTNTTKTYTKQQYADILDARGYEKLKEHLIDFSITCDIEQNNILFGIDYFLGDRMPIKLPEYGISTTARIAEVRLEYEKSGKKVIVTLDDFA